MNKIDYLVGIDESFTRFIYRDVDAKIVKAVNSTMDAEPSRSESYFDIEYPVRTEFLAHNDLSKVVFENENYSNIYTPFERDKVDFSTESTVPRKIFTYAKTFFDVPESGSFNFLFKTCGAAIIWVNGEKQVEFAPYTRNFGSAKMITLSLSSGINEIVIYFEDLVERDASFFFELQNKNPSTIAGFVPLATDHDEYCEAEQLLRNMCLERDMFKSGQINLEVHMPDRTKDTPLRIRTNYREKFFSEDSQNGDITDFAVPDFTVVVKKDAKTCTLADVATFQTAGFTNFELGIELSDGSWLTRNVTCSVYNEEKLGKIVTASTLAGRKKQALDYFSAMELDDINVLLSKAFLNEVEPGMLDTYTSAFKLIEEKGDCADFVLAPLLAVYSKFTDRFPEEFTPFMEKLALDFRYWIDEPGNDVMWYFSENHALLFHVSQYFAGHLYPNQIFNVSGRRGEQQYAKGKQRLEAWFKQFFKYGFAEWNSTTYFPIDFIGFFSLYLAAPDDDIKALAKKALDYTFKMIAINYHGGTMTSTFGRVYEHNLKAMQLGEISNIIQIAWNHGYFNNSLRSSALFAMTDYEPPKEDEKYLCVNQDVNVKAEYLQGENGVCTYLYKNKEYSLATAVNYKPYTHGHQQHIVNVSLGDSTILWLTNPGESEYSGDGRPSYWAGNDVMPLAMQYKNNAFLHYRLNDSCYKFIHLYLPYWDLDDIIEDTNWIFIRKGESYLAIFFTNPFERSWHSSVYGREIIANGEDQEIMIKCSSKTEAGSFDHFRQLLIDSQLDYRDEKISLHDFEHGDMTFSDKLVVNGKEIIYTKSYDLAIDLIKRGE